MVSANRKYARFISFLETVLIAEINKKIKTGGTCTAPKKYFVLCLFFKITAISTELKFFLTSHCLGTSVIRLNFLIFFTF